VARLQSSMRSPVSMICDLLSEAVSSLHTYTHTHTHTYICIYIYICLNDNNLWWIRKDIKGVGRDQFKLQHTVQIQMKRVLESYNHTILPNESLQFN
jgi:hypothetical protein